MKHFDEARSDVINALSDPQVVSLVEKICAIFDLNGRCRILAKSKPGIDSENLKTLNTIFQSAADDFWMGDEVWIESEKNPASRQAIYDAVWTAAKPIPSHPISYILDRHLSKDAWFGSPLLPPWPLNPNTPPIISFFSFKGGVGRTTALAAFATLVARAGKRVLVVDFDLEAPGIGTLFSVPNEDEPQFGVVDFLLDWPVMKMKKESFEIDAYCRSITDKKIVGESNGEIICVPAGKVDEHFVEKLARVNYEHLYRSASELAATPSVKSPIHEMLKLLKSKWNPEYVLIDSRAGFHDLGGLALSGIAHWHVLFGLNSEQSWQGISVGISHLGEQEILAGRKQRDCTLVQAMTPSPQAGRAQAVASFKNRAYEVFSDRYYNDPDTSNAEWPVPDSEDVEQPHMPQLVSWDSRVFAYDTVADIADTLCEGDYRNLTNHILQKLGRNAL